MLHSPEPIGTPSDHTPLPLPLPLPQTTSAKHLRLTTPYPRTPTTSCNGQNYALSLGVLMHEVGHMFSLGHAHNGIMSSLEGFTDFGALFTNTCHVTRVCRCHRANGSRYTRSCLLILNNHRLLHKYLFLIEFIIVNNCLIFYFE